MPEPRSEESVLCFYFKAIALFMAGRHAEGEHQFETILDEIEQDARLTGIVGTMFGLLEIDSDRQHALMLFERFRERFPTHPYVNKGRLEIAIAKYNEGHIRDALKIAEEIIASSGPGAKMDFIRSVFWNAIYLRGRCLKALGRAFDGERLIQEAQQQVPDLEATWRIR